MQTWTWVQSFFCAAHLDKDGKWHGHTWRVKASWRLDGNTSFDAVKLKEVLENCLEDYDHLSSSDWPVGSGEWAETIGFYMLTFMHCDKIEIWRDCEGMGAIIENNE